MQMKFYDAEYCDFVVWKKDSALFVQRIDLECVFINNAISEAESFIKVGILPELVGHWYTKSRVVTSVANGDDSGTSGSTVEAVPSSSTTTISVSTVPVQGQQISSDVVSDDLQHDMTDVLHDMQVDQQEDSTDNIREDNQDTEEDLHEDDSDTTQDIRRDTEEENSDDDADEKWCYCRRDESFDSMIGCDSEDCLYKWFHLSCLHITPEQVPKGKWYCPDCKITRRGKRTKRS